MTKVDVPVHEMSAAQLEAALQDARQHGADGYWRRRDIERELEARRRGSPSHEAGGGGLWDRLLGALSAPQRRREVLRLRPDAEIAAALTAAIERGAAGHSERLRLEAEVRRRFRQTGRLIRAQPRPATVETPDLKRAPGHPASVPARRSTGDDKRSTLQKHAGGGGGAGAGARANAGAVKRRSRNAIAKRDAASRGHELYWGLSKEQFNSRIDRAWRRSYNPVSPRLRPVVMSFARGVLIVCGVLLTVLGALLTYADMAPGPQFGQSAVLLLGVGPAVITVGIAVLLFVRYIPFRALRHTDFLDLD